MNKRGFEAFSDMLLGIIFIFLLGIMIVTAVFFHKTIVEETDLYSYNQDTSEVKTYVDTTIGLYNYIFVMAIASIIVLMLLSAHYIETSAMFLVVGIIILGIIVMISAPLANSFNELTSDPVLSEKLTDHTLITTLMDDLPLIELITGGLFLIVLYAKKRRTEGGFTPYG